MSTVTAISDATFTRDVLESPVPVLVDFWAPWCGPCRLVAPIVDAIATDYADQLKVVKINVDEHPEIASQYQIRSIPTLILFKDGNPVERVTGAVPKTTLDSTVAKYV
jgi:thioredoxin 1